MKLTSEQQMAYKDLNEMAYVLGLLIELLPLYKETTATASQLADKRLCL